MNQLITSYSLIRPFRVEADGRSEYNDENFITFAEFIKPFFKRLNLGYPKFYKMDSLSKLGFIAAELVIRNKDLERYDRNRIGIVLANASSSLDTDIAHQNTIDDRSRYFPSPSVFVYTLPNIMIGEICIRHKLTGENGFLISEKFDSGLLYGYVHELFQNDRVDACITGWIDLLKEEFEALVFFVEKRATAQVDDTRMVAIPFSQEAMEALYKKT